MLLSKQKQESNQRYSRGKRFQDLHSIKAKLVSVSLLVWQGLVAIEPGNTAQYQRFLATLPIDSVISASGFQKKGGKSAGGGDSTPIAGGADSPFGRGKSPGRSIRFSGILDSPLFTSDLNKTPR